ncbi:hypothetical protein [Corynebacterium nasicanis]|uniref:Uncharacterized protein n=1 Tax=Corynebacterium nasicanis TaxID=1448267 RepID=A0ABW1QAL6_9CORY
MGKLFSQSQQHPWMRQTPGKSIAHPKSELTATAGTSPPTAQPQPQLE